ncbi:HxlR family transcriptional regulator [Pseudonocardia hierapolitana]|uniref:HxlR family transcriptional regulator n=2 Tax=Pseudonocardia hierapolitana TaxID=1128676 RepID=A0A561SQX8_9PSEU|nr:HxlR family transcriptional regulator [Pseudonocardia hierapolitana]
MKVGDRAMLGRLYETEDCSVARALELVGERWTLLILREAMFADSTRFSQFQASLAIAPNILTKRLSALVEAGILHVPPGSHEYVLTAMGMTLKPVVVALARWSDRWIGAGPVRFVHDTCDTEVEHRFWCGGCQGEAQPGDVQVRLRSAEEREALDAARLS